MLGFGFLGFQVSLLPGVAFGFGFGGLVSVVGTVWLVFL